MSTILERLAIELLEGLKLMERCHGFQTLRETEHLTELVNRAPLVLDVGSSDKPKTPETD